MPLIYMYIFVKNSWTGPMFKYLYLYLTFCPASEDIAKVYNSIGGVVVGDVRRSSLPERHLGNVLAHPVGIKRLGGAQE